MSSLAAADRPLASAATLSAGTLQRGLMWLLGVSGAIVFIEPSPYEIAMLIALVVFFATGLRLRAALVPLLMLMVVINIGYTICSAELMDKSIILNWVLTSWYMAVTVLFFAMALAEDTAARLNALRRGLIVGAIIAALAGIAGYFRLVPGGYDLLTLYSRARGTFKDPNVLAAFLILPALFLLQAVVTQPLRKSIGAAIGLGIVALALLLAFSRAAWGQFALCSAFMLILMYVTSDSRRQRSRIVLTAIVAMGTLALLVAVLLSLDSVASLFKERASLHQTYDSGRFGRFGRHALGFQMALDLPLGIGPLQFNRYFPEDTHNSFLNAFMSGGWISGICFPALIFITVIIGFRLVLVRVPWQRAYLAVFTAFLGTVGESFIIDVDHWRHFWLMLGAMWGLAVAAHVWRREQALPASVPAR